MVLLLALAAVPLVSLRRAAGRISLAALILGALAVGSFALGVGLRPLLGPSGGEVLLLLVPSICAYVVLATRRAIASNDGGSEARAWLLPCAVASGLLVVVGVWLCMGRPDASAIPDGCARGHHHLRSGVPGDSVELSQHTGPEQGPYRVTGPIPYWASDRTPHCKLTVANTGHAEQAFELQTPSVASHTILCRALQVAVCADADVLVVAEEGDLPVVGGTVRAARLLPDGLQAVRPTAPALHLGPRRFVALALLGFVAAVIGLVRAERRRVTGGSIEATPYRASAHEPREESGRRGAAPRVPAEAAIAILSTLPLLVFLVLRALS